MCKICDYHNDFAEVSIHQGCDTSIQFNSIYFAFVRSKRGFRPTGYRTCQLVYIIIYTKETTN
jgi:hypothetical protein